MTEEAKPSAEALKVKRPMTNTKPSSDAAYERRIVRAIQAACARLQAKSVRLRYIGSAVTEWVAEATPLPKNVPKKLIADGVLAADTASTTMEMLNRYSDMSVARGSGATILCAIEAMQPVKWWP